jgi:translation elongation factor EF-4
LFLATVMDLVQRKRGTELRTKPIDEEKWLFTARVPWAEVTFASFSYSKSSFFRKLIVHDFYVVGGD